MSIIYEALKKIEAQKPSGTGKFKNLADTPFSSPVSTADAPTLTRLVSSKPRFKIPWKIIALCAGLGVIIAGVVFLFLRVKAAAVSSTSTINVRSRPAHTKASSSSNFVLEGIVYDEKVPLAIINGVVYRHYERLGDYMVIDITEKEVTLRNLNNDGLLHLALPF